MMGEECVQPMLLPASPNDLSEEENRQQLANALWGPGTKKAAVYGVKAPEPAEHKLGHPTKEVLALPPKDPRQISKMIEYMCDKERVSTSMILSHNRMRQVLDIRNAVVYTAVTWYGWGFSELGKLMSRNHTSIIRSYRVARDRAENEPHFAFLCKDLAEHIAGGKINKSYAAKVKT